MGSSRRRSGRKARREIWLSRNYFGGEGRNRTSLVDFFFINIYATNMC